MGGRSPRRTQEPRNATVRLVMRTLFFVTLLAVSALESNVRAQGSVSGVQSLFVGDVTCADLATDCVHDNVVPKHPYLHVVVHDVAGNDDWQVQVGPTCGGDLTTVLGGKSVQPNGYLEMVLDVRVQAEAGISLLGQPGCFVFRGRNHWAVTFYAAYFDDNPSADADIVYAGYRDLHGQPDLPDLDVRYIQRSPAYAFDAHPNAPSPGDVVRFEAHLENAGSQPVGPFRYVWLLDGHPIRNGSVSTPLAPRQQLSLTLAWRWKDGPHDVTLQTFPPGQEVSTANDALTVRTNALTLGFWVEQSAYDYFQQYQWRYCEGLPCATSNSFADWIQRQVNEWNRILRTATYPGLAPNGVADRVALDKIVIVPNGALPLHGGRITNSPDTRDHSVDLQWGLPALDVARGYHRVWEGSFDVDWSLIHELGHARSLADLYRFDVPARDGPAMRVTDARGRLAYDSTHSADPTARLQEFGMANTERFLYQNAEGGIMTCSCTPFYSAYDALVLNRIQGRRATCGNFNPPCNLGDWYADLPPANRIRVLQPTGHPVPDGTEVRLYYDLGTTYADHAFDNQHGATLRVRHGAVTLPSDPFHSGGSTWQGAHNLLLIEVRTAAVDQFCFEEPTDFNLAFWSGYRDTAHPATYTLQLGLARRNGCNMRLPPSRVNEPFGTSPFNSTIRVVRSRTGTRQNSDMVEVQLLDASQPPQPMRNRQLHLVSRRGTVRASGMTDGRGRFRATLPAPSDLAYADDITDNHLHINLRPAPRDVQAGRPR
ncbi:MAG: hypothetical protein PVSMB7_11580 [Chloroflexota bacterium]